MKTKRTSDPNGTKGSVLIEAVFILPIFFLLVVGIVEFGRILMIQQVITYAAREAARAGAVPYNEIDALDTAQSTAALALANSGLDADQATVTRQVVTVNEVPALEVDIEYPYVSQLAAWVPGIDNTFELRSRVFMRREV